MKKALIILMTLSLGLTTAACGANKPSGDAAGTSSASSAADSSAASSSAASSSAASSSAASASAASADATTDAVISTGSVWNYTYAGNEHDYLKAITKTLCELDAENFELKTA